MVEPIPPNSASAPASEPCPRCGGPLEGVGEHRRCSRCGTAVPAQPGHPGPSSRRPRVPWPGVIVLAVAALALAGWLRHTWTKPTAGPSETSGTEAPAAPRVPVPPPPLPTGPAPTRDFTLPVGEALLAGPAHPPAGCDGTPSAATLEQLAYQAGRADKPAAITLQLTLERGTASGSCGDVQVGTSFGSRVVEAPRRLSVPAGAPGTRTPMELRFELPSTLPRVDLAVGFPEPTHPALRVDLVHGKLLRL